MDKLTAVKIKLDGQQEYQGPIPIGASVQNIKWDQARDLRQVLVGTEGNIDIPQDYSIQEQLNAKADKDEITAVQKLIEAFSSEPFTPNEEIKGLRKTVENVLFSGRADNAVKAQFKTAMRLVSTSGIPNDKQNLNLIVTCGNYVINYNNFTNIINNPIPDRGKNNNWAMLKVFTYENFNAKTVTTDYYEENTGQYHPMQLLVSWDFEYIYVRSVSSGSLAASPQNWTWTPWKQLNPNQIIGYLMQGGTPIGVVAQPKFDLNALLTPGNYYCYNGSSEAHAQYGKISNIDNLPPQITNGFILKVQAASGVNPSVNHKSFRQTITAWDSSIQLMRTYYQGQGWKPWNIVLFNTNAQNYIQEQIKTLGYTLEGGSPMGVEGGSYNDLNTIIDIGNYYCYDEQSTPQHGQKSLINNLPQQILDKTAPWYGFTLKVQTAAGYDSNYFRQILAFYDATILLIRYGRKENGIISWRAWHQINLDLDEDDIADNIIQNIKNQDMFYSLFGGTAIGTSGTSKTNLNNVCKPGNYYCFNGSASTGRLEYLENLPSDITNLSDKSILLKVQAGAGLSTNSSVNLDNGWNRYPKQTIYIYNSGDIYIRYGKVTVNQGVIGNVSWTPWRKICFLDNIAKDVQKILQENQEKRIEKEDIIPPTGRYKNLIKPNIPRPKFEIGIISDLHIRAASSAETKKADLQAVEELLDFYLKNDNIKMILNLGDTTQHYASETSPSDIQRVYQKVLDAGKGYAAVLGNHDLQCTSALSEDSGYDLIDKYLNGIDNTILLNQPSGMGFIVDVNNNNNNNNLVYCNNINYESISHKPDRVYMIEYTYVENNETKTIYQPIYLGCCYDIINEEKDNKWKRTITGYTRMHSLDNSISIFAKVCNFLKDKQHCPWIFAAHEIYTLPSNWQKIKRDRDVFITENENGEEHKPSNFYLTDFSGGGANNDDYIANTTKYNNYTALLALMEKGTANNALTITLPRCIEEDPSPEQQQNPTELTPFKLSKTISISNLENYSALNDVALYLSGHGHCDLSYSKAVDFDINIPDVSCSCLAVTTNSIDSGRDFSDIIYDYSNRFSRQTWTTLAICPRTPTLNNNNYQTNEPITYIVQRFGAQNTIGGVPRKKMIYTRNKSFSIPE